MPAPPLVSLPVDTTACTLCLCFCECVLFVLQAEVPFSVCCGRTDIDPVPAVRTQNRESRICITKEPQFAADSGSNVCIHIRWNTNRYVPQMSAEKMGMGRADGGVAVYSRKVMIKDKADNILPDCELC